MLNYKLITRILGILLFIEAGLMAACIVVALIYKESITAMSYSFALSAAIATLMIMASKGAKTNMSRKDGYFVVSSTWIIWTIFGMFPYLLSYSISDVPSAFFETMSGFTSTGATIIDNIDALDRNILFYRSLTQWIGGIGIIFFCLALFPAFGAGEIKLFAAESTGVFHDKVQPRISVAAKWIGSVYLLLTLSCALALLIAGMGLFDAINFAMCTTATGGYSTHSALVRDVYNSPAIEYVLAFFMFLSGINFTLIYYTILKGKIKQLLSNVEFRCYGLIVLITTTICVIGLMINKGQGFELSFRDSIFTIVSLQTTTGLANCDYSLWPIWLMPCLMFVMFCGACSGSTSGAMKCIRLSIMLRSCANEFKRILHPRAFIPIKIGDNIVPQSSFQTLLSFLMLYIGAISLGTFILAVFGVDSGSDAHQFSLYEAFGVSLSSTANIGPAMGYYAMNSWAVLSPIAKIVCSLLFLIGRLEIFPILIIFTKGFWKKG